MIGGTNSAYGALNIPASTRDPGIAVDPSIYDDVDDRYDNDNIALMSMAEAQDLIAGKPEGNFCLRLSGSEPNCLVITTICNGQVLHLVLARPVEIPLATENLLENTDGGVLRGSEHPSIVLSGRHPATFCAC